MTATDVAAAEIFAVVGLLALAVMGVFIAELWRECGPVRPPKRPVYGPPPETYTGPSWPALDALRGDTVALDPVAAEWETEWTEKPWTPWEHETGEWPLYRDVVLTDREARLWRRLRG